MLQFNPIVTEQTTAATDLLLGAVALVLLFLLLRERGDDRLKKLYWANLYGFLAIASFLGTIVHGLELSKSAKALIWQPLYMSLGIVIACFVLGSIHELWDRRVSKRLIPWMLAIAFGFYVITVIVPGSFFIFLIYEGIGVLVSLTIYLYLCAQPGRNDAYWMVAGIFVTIVAAIVEASGTARVTLMWEFDHNGIFHILQIPGLIFIFLGVRASLRRGKTFLAAT
jgi:hypothetical protein